MKRYTIHTFPALALLLAATACTQDDAGTLPDGTQPLTLTAAIEGSTDTRATVDNRWNGDETIALQVTDGDGTEWYDYMVDDKGNLSGDYYWTKPGSVRRLLLDKTRFHHRAGPLPEYHGGKQRLDLERGGRPKQRCGLSVGRPALQ